MSKFLNWLLYDKPFFNKPKKSYSKTIYKENWKKNWLGLIKVYESYDIKYSWCFIKISSHFSEDDTIEDLRNTLTIGLGGYYKKWLLPFSIIKPVLDYTSSFKRGNEEIPYSVYKEREYKISYNKEEGYINLDWNYVDNMLYNITKHKSYSKWITLFWGNFSCSCSKWQLLNLDKSLYKDITKLDYEIKHELEKQQQYIEFTFLDYDKEEITAIGKLCRRVYNYGNMNKVTRWMMKFFRKPIDNIYLEIEFNSEIGPSKGSWKGGTTGQGVQLLPNETPEEAFERYCTDPEVRGFRSSNLTNMTLISYKYFKNVGITDSIPFKQKTLNPHYFNIIDYQDSDNIHDDWENSSDLNLKCFIGKNVKDILKENKLPENLYGIIYEKPLGSILYEFWNKYYAPYTSDKIKSNGIFKYYFTKNAYNYLKDKECFKYVEFMEIKNENDAKKLYKLKNKCKD